MSRRVSVDEMADAIMEELTKYSDLASDELKAAVKSTAQSVRKDIQASAPSRTGKYKKSWSDDEGNLGVHRPCGAFEEPLPAGAPVGTRTRQARRREDTGKAAHRSCGTGGKRKAGKDHRAEAERISL